MRKLLLTLVLALSACGPVMETSYEVVPPVSNEGRQCANMCLTTKQSCEETCRREVTNCENVNTIEAQAKYIVYQSQKDQPAKSPDDFHGSRDCAPDDCIASCNSNYNICHTNCGGQIIPHSQCTAFCE